MVVIQLIVGLGNPGEEYANTRHNTGFRAILHLAKRWEIPSPGNHSHSLVAEGYFSGERVILAQPLTFMNRSAKALESLLGKYVIPLDRILVIYDDMDLDLGAIRIRKKGGDGGHQGLRSIIRSLNDEEFPRLRVGIGRPPLGVDPRTYVLSRLSKEEELQLERGFNCMVKAVETIITTGIDQAMNSYN